MANEVHLKLLKQGVVGWNRWREEDRGITPNLRGADLRGAHLIGARLRGADLSGADLSRAVLSRAELDWANLFGANLSGANLFLARLIGANLSGADLSRAELKRAQLFEANLNGAVLNGANLYGADLINADLARANCSSANFGRALLNEASLREAHLSRAKLFEADLSAVHLSQADLSQADLSQADLSQADLSQADLRRANLNAANLIGADLSRADLFEADLSGATMGLTVLGDLELSTAKGLETVRHRAPSTVGIDTIYRSGGKIPEVFLRGCGVPDTFIAYTSSLTGQAFDYYSCFISYSPENEECAQRLYHDLQGQGVRCWYAPEHTNIGDKMRPAIDQAIRLRDKMLLILSEHSISSDWVGNEVETAFEEETKRKQIVLFPIRLDDAVMGCEAAWAASLRRTRHIGDFARWKEHDPYQQALARLLRDLKPEPG